MKKSGDAIDKVIETLPTEYYVLHLWGGISPELIGPFNEDERDVMARRIYQSGNDNMVLALDCKGSVNIAPYSNKYLEGEED